MASKNSGSVLSRFVMASIPVLMFSLLLVMLPVAANDRVHLLSQNPLYSGVKLSPDGRFLSVMVDDQGKKAIGIIEMSTFEMVHGIRLPGQLQVGSYTWANNERLVIKLAETVPWMKQPQYYGELFAINWDGSDGKMIYGYRAGNVRPGSSINQGQSTRGWADIVNLLPKNERQILIKSTPWSDGRGDRFADLVLLDIYNGRARKLITAPVSYASFMTDKQGELKFALGTHDDYTKRLYRYVKDDNSWVEIAKPNFGSAFYPIGFNENADSVYVLDNYQQDKVGLFQLNLTDFSYRAIFTDPNVDISSYEETQDDNQVFALKLDDGTPRYEVLSDSAVEAKIFKGLLANFPAHSLSITSKTADDAYWTVHTYSDTHPGTYYIYEREQKRLSKLFDAWPALAESHFSATKSITFDSFDGMKIPGYLTLAGADNPKKPLVVLVHGGPHGVRDYWGFDTEVQMLTQAGYSVLQVNYRGSDGYGVAHETAGYLQWGNAMMRDIIAGANWAIAQGYTTAGNLCIMGTSFGGYAALQASTLAPDLFKCAVGVAGVYDLTIMATDGDIPQLAFGVAYLDSVIGQDTAQLKAFSPVYQASKLKANILLAHGKRDKRAPLEHALRMRKALDAADVSYQWLQFNDETHGFYSPENREVYYRSVLAFLQQNLAADAALGSAKQ